MLGLCGCDCSPPPGAADNSFEEEIVGFVRTTLGGSPGVDAAAVDLFSAISNWALIQSALGFAKGAMKAADIIVYLMQFKITSEIPGYGSFTKKAQQAIEDALPILRGIVEENHGYRMFVEIKYYECLPCKGEEQKFEKVWKTKYHKCTRANPQPGDMEDIWGGTNNGLFGYFSHADATNCVNEARSTF